MNGRRVIAPRARAGAPVIGSAAGLGVGDGTGVFETSVPGAVGAGVFGIGVFATGTGVFATGTGVFGTLVPVAAGLGWATTGEVSGSPAHAPKATATLRRSAQKRTGLEESIVAPLQIADLSVVRRPLSVASCNV
jgi:hypothetical protein